MGANGANGNGKIDWLSSWITPEWIERARIRRVDHAEGAELVGRRPKAGEHYQGVVIPYFLPGETVAREVRLRRDIPDYERNLDGTNKEKNKYISPPGRSNLVYFPPDTLPGWLSDPAIECFIVEGEKKALALRRFFAERGEDVLIIALPGVWSFRGKVGIDRGPRGERVTVKGVIADIERIVWRCRQVRILFDTNAITNEQVNAARRVLAIELIKRGAMVRLLDLPVEEGVNGVDDYLGKHGPTIFARYLQEAEDGKNLQGVSAFPLTDTGNAERLIARHGHNLHWNTVTESWYCWDGKRWVRDEHRLVWQWAKETARAIPDVEGPIAENGDDLFVYARKCEARDRISAMLDLAKSEPGIPVQLTQFDRDPYLFNCNNGTLDLRTGELKPHDPADLITKIAPISYDPEATAPRWERFLREIFAGDRDVIDFVWQAVGYSLIDGNPAKCLFVCWGPTNTGKSTFVGALRSLFGEYGAPADIQTFMGRVGPMVYNDLADLYGARLVTASENNESDRLNDGLVKMATGNDPITACRKYENPFKYIPGFKIWLGVNHRPIINDGSGAVWGRLKLLPFEVVFYEPGDENAPPQGPFWDLDLKTALEAELPGILAWAVRGCHDWIENGFRIPKTVSAAVEEYRQESDQVGEFIDERCVVGEEYKVSAGAIYDEYEKWAKSRGVRPMSGIVFGRKLSGKQFKTSHGRNGNFREGIALKTLNV